MPAKAAVAVLAGAAALAAFLATDRAVAEPLLPGNTLRLIVGSAPGGGYDTYARLVARHLGAHLPGRPSVIVSNMPAASGVQLANYLFSLAPKDGTVIGTFNKSLPGYQAGGHAGIKFKAEEFSWIGCLSQTVDVLVVWHTTGVTSIEEAKRKTIIMGALSRIGTNWTYPTLLNALLGTRFKVVVGYESGTAVNLAMEKGEVEGRGSNPWSSWKATSPDWIRDKKIVPILQIGLRKDPDLDHVPLLTELAQNDEQRGIFDFVSSESIDRPFAAPPGVSPEIVAELRKAFDAMTKNPAFLEDAQRQRLDLDPLPGTKVAEIVRAIVNTPPEVIRRFKQITD
jgi:tripartite-type tricarboxylate transporter receptor subunit TctC